MTCCWVAGRARAEIRWTASKGVVPHLAADLLLDEHPGVRVGRRRVRQPRVRAQVPLIVGDRGRRGHCDQDENK
jgi:hypothetical protein